MNDGDFILNAALSECGDIYTREEISLIRSALDLSLQYARNPFIDGVTLDEYNDVRRARVAAALISLKMDAVAVTAGLLRSALLRAGAAPRDIEARFGSQTARIVEESAKILKLRLANKTLKQAESIRKMIFAMTSDIRVLVIILSDRLDLIRNINEVPEERRRAVAQEIIDVWAPLASRIGMSSVKTEMEDLSLKCLHYEAYEHIKRIVAQKKGERASALRQAEEDVALAAREAGLENIKVFSRAKHFWSIYQKMKRRNKAPEELYDLLALRVLCASEADCYTLLALVHSVFKPLKGRFKDYIAKPKSNGYQSLHTAVVDSEDNILEIQIRTFAMDYVAEHGVASHWLYKKGTTRDLVRSEDLAVVNQMRELTRGRMADDEFFKRVKDELLKNSVLVFTPKGDAVELPSGATAIDFAYYIHSAVGEKIFGAKADGHIISLSEPLANTQTIEILTSPSAHPTVNQLYVVKTSKARAKIKAYLMQHDDALIFDKNIIAKKRTEKDERAERAENAVEDEKKSRALESGSPAAGETRGAEDENAPLRIKVGDTSNYLISIAKCCNPAIGDAICGYASRGRGIVVHKAGCANLKKIPDIQNRLIEVAWDRPANPNEIDLRIKAAKSDDLFAQICSVITEQKATIISGSLTDSRSGGLEGVFTIKTPEKTALRAIVKSLRRRGAVSSVRVVR